jgi:3-keto-disaccharide hydrolase
MTLERIVLSLLIVTGMVIGVAPRCPGQEYVSGIKWAEPPVVTPGKKCGDPPSDAIILFDGKDLSKWVNGDKWIVKDGVAIVKDSDITSKDSFGDCQLHVEWSSPVPATGTSQGRGNSGVFLMDRYELQVLDSYKNETYFDGQASAIYKQMPPMVNVTRPPGEWNTYDIVWNGPKFKDDGGLESPAYITVLHNGVLTLNHFALRGNTPYTEYPHYEKHGKLPIHLQNHGNSVRYRNIWVRELKPVKGVREREPYFHDHETGKDTPVDKSKVTGTHYEGDGA